MGMGFLIGVIIALLILLASPVSFYILQKQGKRKKGIIVAIVLAAIVLIPFTSIMLEGKLYSKQDAKEDLKLANLKLENNFEIIKNEVSGMPERYQYTELKISEKDKNRIITEIRKGKSYKVSQNTRILYNEMWMDNSNKNKIAYTNYLFYDEFIRESYYRKEINYVPTMMLVRLNSKSNIMTFERIED